MTNPLLVDQLRPDVIRVSFPNMPRAVGDNAPGDALSSTSYSLVGSGSLSVVGVVESLSDLLSFELRTNRAMPPGPWTLRINSVSLVGGGVEVSSVAFVVRRTRTRISPATDQAGYDSIAQVLGSSRTGRNWEVIKKALGWISQKALAYSRWTFDQQFLDSASGRWLSSSSAMNGLPRPALVGMPDEKFRTLAEAFVGGKLTEPGLLSMLDVFYGSDMTRAIATAGTTEPYALNGGEDLRIEVKGVRHTLLIDSRVLSSVGDADATSTAAALNYAANLQDVPAYFDGTGVAVKCVSKESGLGARLRFLGGSAQAILRFPTELETYASPVLPTWTSSLNLANASTTWTDTGPDGLDLSLVAPGDYVVIVGTEFLSTNRGTFTVLSTSSVVVMGNLVQSVEVDNARGMVQTTAQLSRGSFLFFRPDVIEQSAYGPTLNQAGDRLRITLPTASTAVNRGLTSAGYLHDWPTRTGTASRLDGVTTVAATAHGLSIGAIVDVSIAAPTYAMPTVTAGSGTTTTASPLSSWSDLTDMSSARTEHAAVQISPTSVLVIGGFDGASYLDTCDLLEISGDSILAGGRRQLSYGWTPAAVLPHLRGRFAAVTLPKPAGAPVIFGGYDGAAAANTAHLYDYATDAWIDLRSMTTARYWHTATVTPLDATTPNRVWIAGGLGVAALSSVEVFDPATNTYATTSMAKARYRHSAAYLPGLDTVLISGGLDAAGNPTAHCEGLGARHAIGPMAWARYGHSLIVLDDGRILATGGVGRPANEPGTSIAAILEVEVLDTHTWSWEPAGRLGEALGVGIGARLTSGQWVALGGAGGTYRQGQDGRWSLSAAIASGFPIGPAFAGTDWLLACGGTVTGIPTASARILLPARESIAGAGPRRFVRVETVPSNDSFTVADEPTDDISDWSSMTWAAGPAEGEWRGPYLFDPRGQPPPVGQPTTTTIELHAGRSRSVVAVAVALPASIQYVAFDFGGAGYTGPIRYYGPASATTMRIDPAFVFPTTLPVGTSVVGLLSKGGFVPGEGARGLYQTPSDAATAAARKLMMATSGAGLDREVSVKYPGGRGLGGEEFPDVGEGKISDRPAAWSGK